MDKAARSSIWSSLHKLGLLSVMVGSVLVGAAVQARSPTDNLGTVALATLPVEARTTQGLIRTGGPFPYGKDGAVFGNREQLLPRRERGYYREYTVPTPGSKDRGARRIVCGGERATLPDACYYTADHYASFKLIAQ